MKNRAPLIISLLLVIAAGLYYFQDYIFKKEELATWDFVPQNAISVWESDEPVEVWNRFIATDVWANLSTIPGFHDIDVSLKYLDSLTGFDGNLDRILTTGDFLISTHAISRNQFGHVFYVKLVSENTRQLGLSIIADLKTQLKDSWGERLYNDQLIIDINKNSNSPDLSFFVFDNFLVASTTPFLVEDAIRTVQDQIASFRVTNESAFGLTSLEFDAGNLYLNLDKLNEFQDIFLSVENSELQSVLQSMRGSGYLDIDFDSNYLFANGFLLSNDSSYLEVFEGQGNASTSDFVDYIPGDAAFVYHQSFTNASLWHKNLVDFKSTKWSLRPDSFVQGLELDVDRFLGWMANHVVLMEFEAVEESPNKLVLIQSNDIHESLNQLNSLAEKISEANNDTVYFEYYHDATIKLLSKSNILESLFGEPFSDFPVSYFTSINDWIIFSNDVQPIKQLIDDRESENTWGQSVAASEFLNLTLDESNIGLMVNTTKAWGDVESNLDDYWKTGWNKFSREVKRIDLASIQIGNSGSRHYASIVVKNRKKVDLESSRSLARLIWQSGTGIPIVRKPKVVRNHNSGLSEILTIDSVNNLNLFSNGGELLWSDSLGSQVRGDIYQIDYFKNRKLQYLIATDSLLYLIDRNGDPVDNFPKVQPIENPDALKVIDYDKTRNYRFMFTRERELVLTDKNGTSLDGWNPKLFQGKFLIEPSHIRVRGRDVFLGIRENGIVEMTNRRGEDMPGFPLDLDVQIGGEFFHQVRSSMSSSLVTVLSEEGELINFNMEGEITSREQLYRPASDTRFWLVNDGLGKTFVIVRQDLNRLAVLDNRGSELFEKDYEPDGEFFVQYYNFGADQELISVLGAIADKILIYDGSGTLKVPGLPSSYPLSVIRFSRRSEYHIYTATRDSVYVHSISE